MLNWLVKQCERSDRFAWGLAIFGILVTLVVLGPHAIGR